MEECRGANEIEVVDPFVGFCRNIMQLCNEYFNIVNINVATIISSWE